MEYIVNDSHDPFFNLGLEEYLFQLNDNNTYFWLWQNSSTVVIGKNQNAFHEVDHDFMKKNKITLARRITGGGAVYHDLGNLNFSFIAPSNNKKDYDFLQFSNQIVKALSALGIKAQYSGRNDLLIDGKKFSGSAQFVGESKILHHGTILYSSDLEMIENCLTPSKQKLHAHGVSSVKSRVTLLSKHMGSTMSILEFKDKLAKEIFKDYNSVNILELTVKELQAVNKLRTDKYSSYEWNYGASPEFNYSKSMRFDNCGLINLSMDLKSGVINNCKITGDFFGTGDVSRLEQLLKNNIYSREHILSTITSIDLKYYFNNLTLENFLMLFDIS
ncbi:MAG: lipoate--protein ligase [Spirochaetaceae bacterium]|nr:lipoate--protein ligase [Spirochaetaceae bacterium]